jgi:hypothetical protein
VITAGNTLTEDTRVRARQVPSSSVLKTYSPVRDLIYTTLIQHPGKSWNVKRLTAELPESAWVSRDAVRANLYLLLAEQFLALVPRERVLTLRLTEDGAKAMTAIVRRWRARGLTVRS